MASSMTGWGYGEFQKDGRIITVELRSVNNRYLEISCRTPLHVSQYENQIKRMIKDVLHRGKVYVTISIQGDTQEVLDFKLNPVRAITIKNLLQQLCKSTGIDESLSLDHLLKFSEIFESNVEPGDSDQIWKEIKKPLSDALINLKKMRDAEGEALTKDIVKRIQIIDRLIGEIEKIASQNVETHFKRLSENVSKLVKDQDVDENRLYTEIALMADRMDVTEECVRLKSHTNLFINTLKCEDVVGKKLNFLLQEMHREANTISSKASNSDINHIVVTIKEEIEKLREQVLNLE